MIESKIEETMKELEKYAPTVPSKINGIREKQIMKFLWKYPDSPWQDIAGELKLARSSTYTLVKQLEKEEMISGAYMKPEGDKTKGRKHYSITEKGRKQYEGDLFLEDVIG